MTKATPIKAFTFAAFICAALAIFFIATNPSPSFASGAPKKDGVMSNPLSVEITGIVIPVARERRLANYAFMAIMVHTVDDRSANLVRINSFLVKDAIVRGTSRAPIQLIANNPVDTHALSARLLPMVQSSLAGARISRIEITNFQLMRR